MSNLTNMIEAIAFASGDKVPVKYIIEKLGCKASEANKAIDELKLKYSGDCGIHLLTFNGKIQFASNPSYRKEISDVLTPIKEKELTKTILECAAIIAYKQPITKGELEEIRQVSCDYALHTLLDLEMIVPCGRKDTIGKPILYATTDNFLMRFKLNSIDELPDYDELMAQIAELNGAAMSDDENYLYHREDYVAEGESEEGVIENNTTDDGFELPEFIDSDDDLITIS